MFTTVSGAGPTSSDISGDSRPPDQRYDIGGAASNDIADEETSAAYKQVIDSDVCFRPKVSIIEVLTLLRSALIRYSRD